MARGIVIAAPRSGSGKTLVTLGLIAALKARGLDVAPAKSGPDYIDPAILARVAVRDAVNLDAWAMRPQRLRALAAVSADLLLVEGAMGLFDGAADATGSTADLAATLGLPVVLVVDAEKQSQSIAPLVLGFATWRPDVRIAGLILNRVATQRHETMLVTALKPLGIPVLGALPRRPAFILPERHLGLVLPGEVDGFTGVVAAIQQAVAEYIDLDELLGLAADTPLGAGGRLPPLGQRIAIARDDAFAFVYPHWLADWRAAGAELSFFSPLADETPDPAADAIFLPGGYPELHGATLAAATGFKSALAAAHNRGALVYGECGGFMVLGQTLTTADGVAHEMAGLLPISTAFDGKKKAALGYRRLAHDSPLPWPGRLNGHEFHYSDVRITGQSPLFRATDALGTQLTPMGAVDGRVMGSYAHVIDVA